MNKINGFILMAPFTNNNAGFSMWTFAMRDDDERQFFLKKFLNPVRPERNHLSPEMYDAALKSCIEFEKNKARLYKTVNSLHDKNLVNITHFFRCNSHYYAAEERVLEYRMSFEEMQAFSFTQRLRLCRIIANAARELHHAGIVHADIKKNNILITKDKENALSARIIDYGASFFEDDPPANQSELTGDQLYLAPEACQFMCGEHVKLTCKLDVFALGILFHQILTGDMPQINRDEYDYVYEAVLDHDRVLISDSLPRDMITIIQGMLECKPERRISMEEASADLADLDRPWRTISDLFHIPPDI